MLLVHLHDSVNVWNLQGLMLRQCPQCKFSTCDPTLLRNHLAVHSSLGLYVCRHPGCVAQFLERYQLVSIAVRMRDAPSPSSLLHRFRISEITGQILCSKGYWQFVLTSQVGASDVMWILQLDHDVTDQVLWRQDWMAAWVTAYCHAWSLLVCLHCAHLCRILPCIFIRVKNSFHRKALEMASYPSYMLWNFHKYAIIEFHCLCC